LKEFKVKMEETKKQMVEVGKVALFGEFKKLFEERSEVEAVRWTQYTPYFNDGEPCVFRVNEPMFKIGEDGGDYGDGFVYEYEYGRETKEREQLSDAARAVESCEEILQVLFGDHCQVTIWRDNPEAEVEEYSHD